MARQCHIFIMGFTQAKLNWTGTEGIREEAKSRECMNQPSVELFLPLPWNADVGAIAEYIKRNAGQENPKIYVYAYSWGAGRGFMALAKQLRRRGYSIEHAVLCDPVYHSWMRMWRGMFTFKWNPALVIPHNVKCVQFFYQRNNVPQAATLVAEDSKCTEILPGVRLDRTHEYMDDAPEYRDAVLALMDQVTPGKG